MAVDLDVTELAGTRFAVSPLAETIGGLLLLGGFGAPEPHLRWLRWARQEADGLSLPATWPLLVSDRPSWPEFLLPAPDGVETTIDEDLAALRRTTAGQVRAGLARTFGDDPPPAAARLARRPAAGLRQIAGELRAAYDRLIAPHWPRIRALLDADVAHRASQLTAGGADRLFAALHPDVRPVVRRHAERGLPAFAGAARRRPDRGGTQRASSDLSGDHRRSGSARLSDEYHCLGGGYLALLHLGRAPGVTRRSAVGQHHSASKIGCHASRRRSGSVLTGTAQPLHRRS